MTLGVCASTSIWLGVSYVEQKNAKAEFDFEAEEIFETITTSLSSYEEILTTVKAFFMASSEVTLEEWDLFLGKLQYQTYSPGLQGIAYVERIRSAKDYEALKARLALHGMSDYRIRPEGIRDEYFPVVYLHPLDDRNKKAIGYDIYSETTRKNAIESARKNESASITRRITLVQEGKEDRQSGLLMMIPLFTYERIGKQDAAKELDGIIDGVIRMDDFVNALISPEIFESMRLVIYDHEVSEENKLFDSHKDAKENVPLTRFSSMISPDVYGQKWIITLDGQPAAKFLPLFFGEKSKNINLLILLTGYVFSLLGFYLTRDLQVTAKLKREKIADSILMKADLNIIMRQEESLLKFRDKSEYLFVCIIDIEDSTKITAKLSGPQSALFYSTFHNHMGKIIDSHEGTIVKTMGDAILYYFKAPNPPSKNHCFQALNCCLDLIKRNRDLNRMLSGKALPKINYRVSAVYGSVMSASKNNINDIFGATVNRCSKMNHYAKTNGVVVSEEIRELIMNEPIYKIKKISGAMIDEHGNVLYHVSVA
ncbi:MAG: CHASE domain-containing protein [Opitutales bacterium]|nr:CHASE domain-containing protein [Opitutales bacterium]